MNKSTLTPMLFTSLKGYSKDHLVKDVISGIIVAIIALPLSIALALASGVGPEQGIYTAIIAGFLISFFGGSRVQIAGPTAAFATIVAGIVAKNGMEGLMLATIMAGVILILMGVLHLGTLIRFIPFTITTGFTSGIAVTILIGQLKDFMGLTYPKGTQTIETMEKVHAILDNIDTLNIQALIVGLVCLAVLIAWPFIPKIGETVPASLIAVLVGIGMVKGIGMEVNTIGDLYTISNSLPTLHMPEFSWSAMTNLAPDAFTIAVLAAIESLLSCVVADSMINSHHRSDMELVAQGLGNIGSAFFGGIPATGAIARTAANIKNGGRSPIAGIVHSAVLILVLVILMPYAALIPMPTIAAILFIVAYNMCGWRTFYNLCKKAPKSDSITLVATFLLTVVFDLVVAIGVGMGMACVLLMKRMSDEVAITEWTEIHSNDDPDSMDLRVLPKHVKVFEINGPLFFGATENIAEITLQEHTKVVVLRMRAVPALDASAIHTLIGFFDECRERKVKVVMSHVNEQPMAALEKAGLIERLGADNFQPHIDDALERAAYLASIPFKSTGK